MDPERKSLVVLVIATGLVGGIFWATMAYLLGWPFWVIMGSITGFAVAILTYLAAFKWSIGEDGTST